MTNPVTADASVLKVSDVNGLAFNESRSIDEADRKSAGISDSRYNYGYLDEQTKRMIRRASLKAVAIPGYQLPFAGREMPMPYGWGNGGTDHRYYYWPK